MKCIGPQLSWLTRWRAPSEGDSLACCHDLHLTSSPILSTSPTLTATATTTAASTFWIAIFVTVPTDVEKAIIWASRSGNRVLVEVGQRQALFRESSPSQGCRGQWVPTWESWRSLLAIFLTFTLGPVAFWCKHNTSHWPRAVEAFGCLYHYTAVRRAQKNSVLASAWKFEFLND